MKKVPLVFYSFLKLLYLHGHLRNKVMHIGNNLSIALAKNLVCHERNKDINSKYHFIREYVNNKEVQHEYVKSEDQVAHVFMKNLVVDAFNKI